MIHRRAEVRLQRDMPRSLTIEVLMSFCAVVVVAAIQKFAAALVRLNGVRREVLDVLSFSQELIEQVRRLEVVIRSIPFEFSVSL